jgi:protein O-GlcNAc transferase
MAQGIEAAIEHHRAGALQQAEALYKSLLDLHPDHPDALRLLGLLKHQAGDSAGGERMIRQSIAADPANPKSHDNLGCVLVGAGRSGEAAACFEKAIALNDAHETAYFNLGKLLVADNKLPEACHCFQRAVEIDAADERPRVQLIEALLKLGQAQAALDHIEALLARDSRVIQALSLKAIALSELGRDQDLKVFVDHQAMVRTSMLEDCGASTRPRP